MQPDDRAGQWASYRPLTSRDTIRRSVSLIQCIESSRPCYGRLKDVQIVSANGAEAARFLIRPLRSRPTARWSKSGKEGA
jgi:hypothetical protein